jgi:osmotically-inducible protein OsmY
MRPQAPTQSNPLPSTSRLPPVVAREAHEQLGRSGYGALRDVTCIAIEGVLYLHGSLPSYYLKQVAQEVASTSKGVSRVINRIIVSTPVRRERPTRESFANTPV